jgi:hypothetical protein
MSDTDVKKPSTGQVAPPAARRPLQERRLFVGNLYGDVGEGELREAAEVGLGPVEKCLKYRDRTYGFVTLRNQTDFETAVCNGELMVRGRRARIGVAVRRCGY